MTEKNTDNFLQDFEAFEFQPILSYQEQNEIDQFLNQLVTEDYNTPPFSNYSNYPLQPYPRMNPPTPYLMNASQHQIQPPVPHGPLIQTGTPLFQQNHLFSSPKMNSSHLDTQFRRPQMNDSKSGQLLEKPLQSPNFTLGTNQSPTITSFHSTTPSNVYPIPAASELTEDQKKANHIKSEKKRRQIIRQGFGKLEYFLFEKQPGVQFTQSQQIKSRSEATMLKLTVEYIQHLIVSHKDEYIKLLRNEFLLGLKTEEEIKSELEKLSRDPTFNISYKTQQKIRTYKRVVYNNNKVVSTKSE
eukprot:NODE_8_length_66115_cov_0.981823.p23 type:complete len:300 gc:universal NODE_8_length_66115_cov_0.981823:9170-10069(+)